MTRLRAACRAAALRVVTALEGACGRAREALGARLMVLEEITVEIDVTPGGEKRAGPATVVLQPASRLAPSDRRGCVHYRMADKPPVRSHAVS